MGMLFKEHPVLLIGQSGGCKLARDSSLENGTDMIYHVRRFPMDLLDP